MILLPRIRKTMWSLIFGVASLLLFFVPLLSPFLALLCLVLAVATFLRRRRRGLAIAGVGCSVLSIVLQLWLWRFGHLP